MKKIIIASAAVVIALIVFIITTAWAVTADYQRVPGTVQACPCVAQLQFGDFHISGSGGIKVRTLDNTPPDDPLPGTRLMVEDFEHTQQHPTLGTITWVLDKARPVISEIHSLVPGEAYPAEANFQWHALATVAGGVYRTVQPIHVRANINSWPPVATSYHQVQPTRIERSTGGGFEISGIHAVVN